MCGESVKRWGVWYQVNYSAADLLAWGLGQECDFVNKSCASWSDDLGYV
jgi:hypothetical protein